MFEIIAPKIAGVTLSSGELVPAKQKIDGGPSVLYDAVALLVRRTVRRCSPKISHRRTSSATLSRTASSSPTATTAQPLLEAAGIMSMLDGGCFLIKSREDADRFIEACGKLRYWERERKVDLDG